MSVTQTADGRYTFEHPTLGPIAGLTQSGVDQMQAELAGDPRQAAQLARRNPPPPAATPPSDDRYTFEHPSVGSITGLTQSGLDQMHAEVYGTPATSGETGQNQAGGYQPQPVTTQTAQSPGILAGADFFDAYRKAQDSGGTFRTGDMRYGEYQGGGGGGDIGRYFPPRQQPMPPGYRNPYAPSPFYQQRFDRYAPMMPQGGGGGGGYNPRGGGGMFGGGGGYNPYLPQRDWRGSQFPGGGRYGNQNMGPIRGGGMGQVIPTNIPFRDQGYGAPMLSQNLIQSLSGPNNLMNPYRRDTTLDMLSRFRGGGGGWGGMPNDPYYGDPYYGGGGGQPGGGKGGNLPIGQRPTDQGPLPETQTPGWSLSPPPPGADGRYTFSHPTQGDITGLTEDGWRQMELEVYGPSGKQPSTGEAPPPETKAATGSDYGITAPGGYEYKKADWDRFTAQGGIDTNQNRRIDPDEYATYKALIASRVASRQTPAAENTPPPETQVATGSDYGITAPGGYEYKKSDWDRFTSQGGIDTNKNRRIDPDEYATYKALIASRVASRQPPAGGTQAPPAGTQAPPANTQQAPAGNWPPFDINNTTSPWFTIDLGQSGGSTTIRNNNYIDPSNTPPAETQAPPPAETQAPPPETQAPPPATTQVATGSDYGITGPGGYEYKKADWDRFTSQGGIDRNENRRIDPDEFAAYEALIASRQASGGNTPPPATGGTPPPATGGTPPSAGNDQANPYNHSPEVVAALIAQGIDPATFNPADINIGNISFARGGHVGLGSMFARGGHAGAAQPMRRASPPIERRNLPADLAGLQARAGNLGRRPAPNLKGMLDQLDLRRA